MRGPIFEEFFSNEFGPLVAFLMKNGFERELAKDAASEAMTCAYKEWYRIELPRAWVRTVAYRIALKQAQRALEESRRAAAGGWTMCEHYDVDVVELAVEIAEEDELLLRLLERLPPRQRIVMVWHLDGFDAKEISGHLGMPEATVRSNLRHARRRLKVMYQVRLAGPPDDEGRK